MKWGALFLGLVSAVALYVFLQTALVSSEANGDESQSERPASGMALLDAYRCHRAETKRVFIRGIEDGYSPAGDEFARSNPRLEGRSLASQLRQVDYDHPREDGEVRDYFELESNTVSGIVVIRLRPIGDVSSDFIQVGDLTTALKDAPIDTYKVHAARFAGLAGDGTWKASNDIRWAAFEDLALNSGGTLLDLIRSAEGKRIVDVAVGDDLSVDFIGMAVCEPPPRGSGLSMRYLASAADPRRDLVAFACVGDDAAEAECDPFSGDQPCERELPLLCYIDRRTPAPRYSEREAFDLRTRRWSGGEVAATSPLAAGSFKTLGQADGYCAAQFGDGWRVAEWHLGGAGWRFSAKGGGRKFAGLYWIDIMNQPYATCWSRERGR